MLTSDKLSALDNMSMWVVNGDFKGCNEGGEGRQNRFHEQHNSSVQYIILQPDQFTEFKVAMAKQFCSTGTDFTDTAHFEVKALKETLYFTKTDQ